MFAAGAGFVLPHQDRGRTFKRGETTAQDQFKIAELSLSKDNSRQLLCLCRKLCMPGQISCKEISVFVSFTAG